MTTDELRAKFDAWWNSDEPTPTFNCRLDSPLRWALAGWYAAHASRDDEVEALQDALFQISVRLKAEREPDMDDMSWHTDMIDRAQYLANLEDAAMREGK